MKIKMKINNKSHIFDIDGPRSRNGHKYSKYKKCLSMMMLLCINPFSTNVPLMWKPDSWFLLAKCLKRSVDDLHPYLKCHSSTGVFQTFC